MKSDRTQKHGNERWHLSAIERHLLRFHKKPEPDDMDTDDTDDTQSQQLRRASQSNDIADVDEDFLGFPNTSSSVNSLPLTRKRRIQPPQDSPAKRTRSKNSK